jgi:hypothetical protein
VRSLRHALCSALPKYVLLHVCCGDASCGDASCKVCDQLQGALGAGLPLYAVMRRVCSSHGGWLLSLGRCDLHLSLQYLQHRQQTGNKAPSMHAFLACMCLDILAAHVLDMLMLLRWMDLASTSTVAGASTV